MNALFSEDETIITPDGIKYLNKEASRKFYELYKDIIGDRYSNTLFRYDLVLKACSSLPRKKELSDIEKLKEEYNKLVVDGEISKKNFYSLLYSCSRIIKKRVSLNDLKEYAKELNNDLYGNNVNEFDLYIVLCQKGFNFVLNNYCENLDDLLYLLELEKEFDIKSEDVECEVIDNWIMNNKFYSFKHKKDFINFLSEIRKDKYYYSTELFLFLDNKYDLFSITEYGVVIEEQLKIENTFDNDIEYIFKLHNILDKKIDFHKLVKYALYIKRKFKIDYDENSLKLFVRLENEEKPIVLTNLLEYTTNLFDLLKLLQLPIIYKFDVCDIDLDILDTWFDKHKYYSLKNKKVLENKFLNSLKTCPKDYYNSKEILNHIESKLNKDNIFIDDIDYKVIKLYKPVTETKKKKLVGALFFSTGIIASLYLTIIKTEYPSKVIVNCGKTFKKYSTFNPYLKSAVSKIGNLNDYFKIILTTNIGGYLVKTYFEEDEIFDNKEVK
jgi:hypothetical protein